MPARYVVRALEALPDGTSLRYVGAVGLALAAYVGFTTAYYVFSIYLIHFRIIYASLFGVGFVVGRYSERPSQAIAGALTVGVVGTVAVWTLIWALTVVYVVAPTSLGTITAIGLLTLSYVAAIVFGAFSGYVAV